MAGARNLIACLLSAGLAACATPRPAPVQDLGTPAQTAAGTGSDAAAAPSQTPATGEAVTIPLGEPGAASGDAPPGAPPVVQGGGGSAANPAVIALLNDANQAMQQGRNERAAASLERALAIEPRNAWLWHRLARARLAQGEIEQAASLAAKSNSLAAENRSLQAKNWRVIADVHRRRGDLDSARSAEDYAEQLARP